MFVCSWVPHTKHFSPYARLCICGDPEVTSLLFGYCNGPRLEAYEGFRTFDLLSNSAPVSLIGTAAVDGTKVWIGCLRPSHFQLQ